MELKANPSTFHVRILLSKLENTPNLVEGDIPINKLVDSEL